MSRESVTDNTDSAVNKMTSLVNRIIISGALMSLIEPTAEADESTMVKSKVRECHLVPLIN
jgi:hypothetical protein